MGILHNEIESTPLEYCDVIFKYWGYIIMTIGLFCPS
jgi:hypothetical protein